MLSRPERYLTYSACTSAVGRTGDRAGMNAGALIATATPQAPTAQPPNRLTALFPITHPPNPASGVVRHEQRAVGHHQQSHRPAPARPVGKLPPGHEIRSEERRVGKECRS